MNTVGGYDGFAWGASGEARVERDGDDLLAPPRLQARDAHRFRDADGPVGQEVAQPAHHPVLLDGRHLPQEGGTRPAGRRCGQQHAALRAGVDDAGTGPDVSGERPPEPGHGDGGRRHPPARRGTAVAGEGTPHGDHGRLDARRDELVDERSLARHHHVGGEPVLGKVLREEVNAALRAGVRVAVRVDERDVPGRRRPRRHRGGMVRVLATRPMPRAGHRRGGLHRFAPRRLVAGRRPRGARCSTTSRPDGSPTSSDRLTDIRFVNGSILDDGLVAYRGGAGRPGLPPRRRGRRAQHRRRPAPLAAHQHAGDGERARRLLPVLAEGARRLDVGGVRQDRADPDVRGRRSGARPHDGAPVVVLDRQGDRRAPGVRVRRGRACRS